MERLINNSALSAQEKKDLLKLIDSKFKEKNERIYKLEKAISILLDRLNNLISKDINL